MAGRRGNGEGSFTKRPDGLYMGRITIDGERKTVYGKTRKEAQEKIEELKRLASQGLAQLDEKQTVEQYLATWLELKRPQLKASTLRPYRNDIELRLIPHLGKLPLTKLSAQHLQLMYARLIESGTSAKTVTDCHGVLHSALEDAVRMGLVVRNVADMARTPRKVRPEMRIFTVDEIHRFLDQVRGDRFEALYILAFATGMREGELLGLRWPDVDFPTQTLQVRVAVTETDDDRFVLAEPKTPYSRRTIALPEEAVQALLDQWKRQIAEREHMGDLWKDQLNLVFPNGFGGIMIPHNITKRSFKRHLVAAGIAKATRFHDIRHTHATHLLAAGVNVKAVSERLGHADVATTLRVYAHVLPTMQQSAVDATAVLLASRELRKIEAPTTKLV